jgi:hypothetical protein
MVKGMNPQLLRSENDDKNVLMSLKRTYRNSSLNPKRTQINNLRNRNN